MYAFTSRKFNALILVAACGFLAGCGGNGTGQVVTSSLTPGYYTGSIQYFNTTKFGSGTYPVAASVCSANGFYVYWATGNLVCASGTGTISLGQGEVFGSTILVPDGTGYKFTVTNSNVTYAVGSLTPALPPTLGRESLAPPAGTYVGTYLALGPNGPLGFGNTVIAQVNENGELFVEDGTDNAFVASFGPNHEIVNSLGIFGGAANVQKTAQYSFDGKQLVVRFDQLLLTPESEWFTLTPEAYIPPSPVSPRRS